MDVREVLFRWRSYTPVPWLLLMIIFANPTTVSLLVGLICVLVGESLRMWGVSIAGSETRTTGSVGGTFLITQGPFGYVRNPLYLGNMIIYGGVGIMANALVPWLPGVALVYFYWQYAMIVDIEEEHLAGKFGSEYDRYVKSVPRFVPSFRRYAPGTNEQPSLDLWRGLASERSTLLAIGSMMLVLLVMMFLR